MALDFPWQMFMEAQRQKNQNQQNMEQNIAGIGEGFGQSMGAIGEAVKQQKQKQLLSQLVKAMQGQGQPLAPVQGPQGYVPPGAGASAIPAGQVPPGQQDNTQQINSLMTKLDPQMAIKAHFQKQNAARQTSPWRVVSGMLSKNGKPVQQNEMTGEVREVDLGVQPTGRGNSAFGMATKWDDMPPEMRDLGKNAYEGNIEVEKLGFREKTQAILAANEYARANKLPPFKTYTGTIRAGTSKSFAYGKPAQNVLSLNTALGHAKSALDAYANVKNLDQRFLNVPLNKARAMTNDPNIIKLQISLNALSGELATVFKGSAGTDQEIGHWINVLSQDLTAGQAVAAIQQVNDLLNSRLQALEQMRSQGTSGRPATGPLLSPHASQLNKQFGQMGKSSGGQKIGRFEVQVNP